MRTKDPFVRAWIVENSIRVIQQYSPGDLTIRALHYQLVGLGMTNTIQHYKRVVEAMEYARWAGLVDFDTFSDLDRTMVGETEAEPTDVSDKIDEAQHQLRLWMTSYRKNRWENQPIYTEVFIEKKALQNVFQPICYDNRVALGAVKGYPSLTFQYEAAERFKEQIGRGKKAVILYFGDYDPSGEDIPRSIRDTLYKLGADVDVRRQALFESQVLEWKLPPAPAKVTDSRTANWDGLGQVELDAVKPEVLRRMCQEAIDSVFDDKSHNNLLADESRERDLYVANLKDFVKTL